MDFSDDRAVGLSAAQTDAPRDVSPLALILPLSRYADVAAANSVFTGYVHV